jgi:hypothetical protein
LKKLFLVLLAAVALTSSGIISSPPAKAGENVQGAHVVAYYFHGTFRCPTCQKLERYSREAIESNFNEALASGKLAFTVVNVEINGNEHYMSDYQLYTKSLVLSLTKNGKEVAFKNLDKIWEYVGGKQRFEDYVRNEVAAFLKAT